MRIPSVALAFLTVLTAFLASAESEVRTYRITRTLAPPRIDGVLDDANWKDAVTLKDFHPLGGATPKELPPETQAWLAYDAEHLYVAYRCAEPLSPNILMNVKAHDGPTWTDDCVEIFFNPSGDRQRYVQVAINAAGVVMDAYYDQPNAPGELGYETGAEAATKVAEGVWTLEARIPFSGLPLNGPSGLWTFHLARTRAKAGQHLTSLQSSVNGFHDLLRFDVLDGVLLPDRTISLLDASPGELLPGCNVARAMLKNWGDKPAQVEVTAGVVGVASRARATVRAEPGKTALAQVKWELDAAAAGKRASVAALMGDRVIQERAVLIPAKPPELFGRLKTNAYAVAPSDFVRIDLPVNLAEGTRPELQLRWEAREDASGKTVGRGVTAVRDRDALVRLYWPGWSEGFYTLKLELFRGNRPLGVAERTIRLVESPWRED